MSQTRQANTRRRAVRHSVCVVTCPVSSVSTRGGRCGRCLSATQLLSTAHTSTSPPRTRHHHHHHHHSTSYLELAASLSVCLSTDTHPSPSTSSHPPHTTTPIMSRLGYLLALLALVFAATSQTQAETIVSDSLGNSIGLPLGGGNATGTITNTNSLTSTSPYTLSVYINDGNNNGVSAAARRHDGRGRVLLLQHADERQVRQRDAGQLRLQQQFQPRQSDAGQPGDPVPRHRVQSDQRGRPLPVRLHDPGPQLHSGEPDLH